MPATNPFESNARYRKRDALLAQLDRIITMCGLSTRNDAVIVVGVLRDWTHARWTELAVSCGQREPSDITKQMVIDALLARGKAA